MTWLRNLTLVAAFLSGCAPRPHFLPAPNSAFVGFYAFDQPRPDAPVGALWIKGYGFTGDQAATENIQVERSLSGLTVDSGFQATLSLGILQFLNLDPSLRNKFTARLNDISILRVKDLSKLVGPHGQPRLYEALKAASITITATHDVGLDIEARAAQQNLPVIGRGTSGRLSTFTIEAKDMFFAYRIVRQVETLSEPKDMTVGSHASQAWGNGLRVSLSRPKSVGSKCASVTIDANVDGQHLPVKEVAGNDGDGRIPLSVPRSDGNQGLYDSILIRLERSKAGAFCPRRAIIQLAGQRMEFLVDGTWRGTPMPAIGKDFESRPSSQNAPGPSSVQRVAPPSPAPSEQAPR